MARVSPTSEVLLTHHARRQLTWIRSGQLRNLSGSQLSVPSQNGTNWDGWSLLGRGLLSQLGCGESGGSLARVIDSRLVPVLCLRANRRVQVPRVEARPGVP